MTLWMHSSTDLKTEKNSQLKNLSLSALDQEKADADCTGTLYKQSKEWM